MTPTPYRPALQTSCIVDVSHNDNNGQPIDWAAVKADAPWLRAVFAKATQGIGFVDPQWANNRAGIVTAGLLCGGYHFCTGDDPASQVAHLLAVLGDTKGLLVALDWEPNPDGSTATVAQVGQMAFALRQARVQPVIYCGRSMSGLPSPILASCDLWLPEYGNEPICPPGWSKWRLHQYTDAGIVQGINGAVDLNWYDETQGALESWWPRAAPAPAAPVQPPSPPVTSTGNRDQRLQLMLIAAGHSCGPDGADGRWGTLSEAAWQAWRAAQ